MAASLKDQLLKAGIVDEKKAKQATQQKKKQAKKAKQARKSGVAVDDNDQQDRLEKERLAKQERDKALNKQRDEERAQKARLAEVRQLVERHSVALSESAEVAYNFVHDTKVKRIYVTEQQQKELVRGQLAIAIMEESYRLVPDKAAERIEMRLPELVIRITPEEEPDEDDPYAAYKIPDDLMW